VVYQKQPGVVAVRIDRDGHVRDAVPLELASFSAFYPISLDVSFGGGVYLVVWEQARGNSTAMMDVRATRVTPAGEVLDAPSRVLVAGAGQDMSVASDGERFLVAYWDGDIYGVVVGADGAVARSRVALATGDKTYVQPRLAWDGARYLLLCAERAWLGQGALRDDAILLALDRDGAAAGDPVRVADDVVLEQLSLASRGDGSALVAYARYDASPDLQSVRVKLRTITPDQAPPRPDDMPPPGDVSAQGCGCRAGDAGGGGDGWAVLLLLLAAAVLARRRAAR